MTPQEKAKEMAKTLVAEDQNNWIRYNRWAYEDSRKGNEAMEKDFRKAMEEQL